MGEAAEAPEPTPSPPPESPTPSPKPGPRPTPAEVRKAAPPPPPKPPAPESLPTGRLVIRSFPTTQVRVDGKPAGTTPLELDVAAGRRSITFVSLEDGTVIEKREVDVTAGETLKIKRR